MARDAELRARITADDQASKVIKKVADAAEDLEDKPVEVEVDAKTAEADRKLAEIDRQIAALEHERAQVDVDADTADADRKLDEIDRQVDALKRERVRIDVDADTTKAQGAMSKLGTAGAGALSFLKNNVTEIATGAGAAIAAFAAKGVSDFQDLALAAGKIRDALGLTAEQSSRWVEVAGDIGISTEAIEKTFGKLIQTVGKSPDAFADMGIQLAYAADGAVDVSETMLNVIGHLNQIQDPTQRAAEAQKLLGKNWKDAAELIAAGADDVRSSLADVADAKIVDDKDINQARRYRDAMDDLADVGEELSIVLGETLVPILTDVAANVTAIVGPAKQLKSAFDSVTNVPVIKQLYENFAPWKQIPTRIDQVRGAWDRLFGGGGTVPAQWFRDAADAMTDMGKTTTGTTALLQGLAEIGIGAATDATNENIDAIKEWAEAQQEAAAAAEDYIDTISGADWAATGGLDTAVAGMSAFHDQFFALSNIAADNEAAFDKFSQSLKENGDTFDLNTDKGRDNQAALEDLAGTLDVQLAAALADSGGSLDVFKGKAAGVASTLRDRLINELGMSEQAADDVIRQLGLMPADIETRYQLSGTEEARAKLDLLQGSIDALPDDVRTRVTQQIIVGDYQGALNTVQSYYNSHPATVKLNVVTTRIPNFFVPGGTTTTTAAPVGLSATMTAVPLTVDLGSIPTGAQIARRIGPIRLPFSVASSLRADERLAGARDL